MPDVGGQSVGRAAGEAEDQTDRLIAEAVKCGYLFAVVDPETGEVHYGATPAGLVWLQNGMKWPDPDTPPAPASEGVPAPRRRAHAAPKRGARRTAFLAGVAAVITLPSIAITGKIAVSPTGKDIPQTERDTSVPDSGNTSEMGGQRTPAKEGKDAKKPAAPQTPDASPTSTVRQGAHDTTDYVGRHRGRPAREGVKDMPSSDVFNGMPGRERYKVEVTFPGAGSGHGVSVHVTSTHRESSGYDKHGGHRGYGDGESDSRTHRGGHHDGERGRRA